MQTDAQRLGGLCERLRKLVRLSREDLARKEARLQTLQDRLETATPEQAEILRPLVADLQADIEHDRANLENLERDVQETCGGV